jgi:hypothetical protein
MRSRARRERSTRINWRGQGWETIAYSSLILSMLKLKGLDFSRHQINNRWSVHKQKEWFFTSLKPIKATVIEKLHKRPLTFEWVKIVTWIHRCSSTTTSSWQRAWTRVRSPIKISQLTRCTPLADKHHCQQVFSIIKIVVLWSSAPPPPTTTTMIGV